MRVLRFESASRRKRVGSWGWQLGLGRLTALAVGRQMTELAPVFAFFCGTYDNREITQMTKVYNGRPWGKNENPDAHGAGSDACTVVCFNGELLGSHYFGSVRRHAPLTSCGLRVPAEKKLLYSDTYATILLILTTRYQNTFNTHQLTFCSAACKSLLFSPRSTHSSLVCVCACMRRCLCHRMANSE
jgi:hypothetical protein